MIAPLFYRLPELEERWACTVKVILQSAIAGQVQICYPLAALSHRTKTTRRMEPIPGGRMVDDNPTRGYATLGSVYLQMIEAGEEAAVLKYDFNVWRVIFEPPLLVRREDLVVLRSEVERLERQGFAQASVQSAAPVPVPPRPEAETGAPLPAAAEEPPVTTGPSSPTRKTRSDPLTVEIEAALSRLPIASHRDVHSVFAELAKVSAKLGSCVLEVGRGFLIWQKSDGRQDRVDRDALKKRLKRLAAKPLSTAD